MINHFGLRLLDNYMIAPSVRHFCFQLAEPNAAGVRTLGFIPGQFLQVHFHSPDGKPSKRSYSIATVSDSAQQGVAQIEIAVSYVEGGAATQLFQQLKIGDLVEASGPYGRFCLSPQDQNKRYLLVATGTGITPYRAMLPELKTLIDNRGVQVDLLFGARNENELLYGAEFDAFANANSNFRFHPCFSRAPRTPAGAYDRSGYVQDALATLLPNADNDIAYLCGNPNMVDACFVQLKDSGMPVPHIRREKYISSK